MVPEFVPNIAARRVASCAKEKRGGQRPPKWSASLGQGRLRRRPFAQGKGSPRATACPEATEAGAGLQRGRSGVSKDRRDAGDEAGVSCWPRKFGSVPAREEGGSWKAVEDSWDGLY